MGFIKSLYHCTYVVFSTSRALGRGSVGDAVAGAGVEAEELGANSVIFEAGAGRRWEVIIENISTFLETLTVKTLL